MRHFFFREKRKLRATEYEVIAAFVAELIGYFIETTDIRFSGGFYTFINYFHKRFLVAFARHGVFNAESLELTLV